MIRGTERILYSVTFAFKRTKTGFVVKMGIYEIIYAVFFGKLRKTGILPLFIEGRKVQHQYAHRAFRQAVKAHPQPNKLAFIYGPVLCFAVPRRTGTYPAPASTYRYIVNGKTVVLKCKAAIGQCGANLAERAPPVIMIAAQKQLCAG